MTTDQTKQIEAIVNRRWCFAFWRWPSLIRELHAELSQLREEHSKTQVGVRKLTEWIHVTHRLGAPQRGIRALMSRAARVALFFLPLMLAGAQPAPILRNSWTTNTAGQPVQGLNNLSVTNLGSGTNWEFFNVGPFTIARLVDVTNIAGSFSGGDAGGTNSRQGGSLVLTNLSNNPIPFTNIILADVGIALGTNSGITYITNTINTNAFQPASANLTNWSNIPTGAMANVVATDYLTNWANSISNLVNTKQHGSANLTNWSNIPTGAMANIPAVTFLTNWANSISNLAQTKQHGTASLTNLSGNPNVVTNILGAGTVTVTSNNLGTFTITGAGGAGGAFNVNQFSATTVTNIKDGALLTNIVHHGSTNVGTMNMVAGSVIGWPSFTLSENVPAGTQLIFSGQISVVGSSTLDTGVLLPHLTASRSAILDANQYLTNAAADFNWSIYPTNIWNNRQIGSATLTNLSNNPYKGYTNEVFDGTNISVRTVGGTNFIDTIGELNNWAQFPTNVWNSRQGGTAALTNLSGNPNVATNLLGAGTVTVTSNNLGTWTITGSGGGGGATIQTNTVFVSTTAATNLNFIQGTYLSFKATNASGDVSIQHDLTDANLTNWAKIPTNQFAAVGVYRTLYVDAGAMVPNSTLGAQFDTIEFATPTNRMLDNYIFTEAVSNIVQFKMAMPMEWDLSTVKFKLFYTSTNAGATVTNVWEINSRAISDDDPLDQDWGTAITVTNKITAANDLLRTIATPAITIGGSPAAEDLVWFRIRRLSAHGNDNDNGQVRLLGAWMQYKETLGPSPALW